MEDKTIIEINGVKLQVDLRHAKRIEEYKIGDQVKVLVKKYSDSYYSYYGTIIGFDNFEKLPTILIAYVCNDYSNANIEIIYFNSKTDDVEICSCNNGDIFLDKNEILRKMDNEIEKKEDEVKDLKMKKKYFKDMFGKYFEETKTNDDK